MGRYNQTGARCGEEIAESDFHFSAFQAGVIDEAALRATLGVTVGGTSIVDHYWNNCIRFEKDQARDPQDPRT